MIGGKKKGKFIDCGYGGEAIIQFWITIIFFNHNDYFCVRHSSLNWKMHTNVV